MRTNSFADALRGVSKADENKVVDQFVTRA
jgi:hypothetical protein